MNLIITGTDTDVGKTLIVSWLMLHFTAYYWKPIQSGLPSDTSTAQQLSQLPQERFLPPAYEFTRPLSPHLAARLENQEIKLDHLHLPLLPSSTYKTTIIIEGAGGLFVPLNSHQFMIDLIHKLASPVLIIARSTLGTINHTCLTVRALQSFNIPILGIILNGPIVGNKQAIEEFTNIPVLHEFPPLSVVTQQTLLALKPSIQLIHKLYGLTKTRP